MEFDATALRLGTPTYSPVITPELARKLKTATFGADAAHVLTEGFQPFNLVPQGYGLQGASAMQAARDLDYLAGGDATLNLDDVRTLEGRLSLVIPQTISAVTIHFRTTHVAFATMWGDEHPLTIHMGRLLAGWVDEEMELPSWLQGVQHYAAACVLYVTQRVHAYYHAARMHPAVIPVAPRLEELLDELRLSRFPALAP